MRRVLLPLIACTLLAACGSDDGGGGGGAPAGVQTTGGGGSGQQVAMVDLKFQPETVRVNVGETVTWVNQDNVPHNAVNQREGREPKSELFNEGGTYSWTPTEPGTVDYVCTIHPGMEGRIEVGEG
jgi:plastocyanin